MQRITHPVFNRHVALCGLLTWVCLMCASASEAAMYDFLQLNASPGASVTEALGINDHGDIVGGYRDAQGSNRGFLYSNGTFTPLDVPFPVYSDPPPILQTPPEGGE